MLQKNQAIFCNQKWQFFSNRNTFIWIVQWI